eukprot:9062926-Alexandrium_andersonii.AAC.1
MELKSLLAAEAFAPLGRWQIMVPSPNIGIGAPQRTVAQRCPRDPGATGGRQHQGRWPPEPPGAGGGLP